MPVTEVADAIGWEVVEKCAGGEFGAHLVRRGNGSAILKVHEGAHWLETLTPRMELTERVRERGQLAPRWLDIGVRGDETYTLQEFMPGQLAEPFTLDHARRMIELLATHEGAAIGLRNDRDVVGDHHKLIGTFAARGGRLADVASELIEALSRYERVELRSSDVVHSDYHHRNVLVNGPAVTAVIDWDAPHAGDCRFDAFLLAYWAAAVPDHFALGVEPWLKGHVLATIGADQRAVFAIDVAIRNVAFYSAQRPEVTDWAIETVHRCLAPYWRR